MTEINSEDEPPSTWEIEQRLTSNEKSRMWHKVDRINPSFTGIQISKGVLFENKRSFRRLDADKVKNRRGHSTWGRFANSPGLTLSLARWCTPQPEDLPIQAAACYPQLSISRQRRSTQLHKFALGVSTSRALLGYPVLRGPAEDRDVQGYRTLRKSWGHRVCHNWPPASS